MERKNSHDKGPGKSACCNNKALVPIFRAIKRKEKTNNNRFKLCHDNKQMKTNSCAKHTVPVQ